MPFFNISCITHRKNPIYTAFLSQFPPSESSKLRGVGAEAALYKFLKHDCNISGILDVALLESCGAAPYMVIRMRPSFPSEAWQALNGAVAFGPGIGKFIVAVDEDIDPWDAESVNWALSFRVQPHLDTAITLGKESHLDPSSSPATDPQIYPPPHGCSAILINATMKWPYPPVSLPKKEYMDKAHQIWDELGLPHLSPKVPWHGYPLGYWEPEHAEEADLAVRGEYYQTGEKFARRRVKI